MAVKFATDKGGQLLEGRVPQVGSWDSLYGPGPRRLLCACRYFLFA